MMQSNLSSQVAFVTGGASGLGAEITRMLVAQKCKVVIADLNEALGAELVEELGRTNCSFIKMDVTKEKEVEEALKKTVELFGSVTIVVNSAGIAMIQMMYHPKRGLMSTEKFRRIIEVNLIGTFNVCKHAAVIMSKQKMINEYDQRGVIIMISSIMATEAPKGQLPYAASKGGLNGMTLPMARELGKHGIRVVTISPGLTFTPMVQNSLAPGSTQETFDSLFSKEIPLGRIGRPVDVAQVCIAAIKSTYLTGAILRIDGGHRVGI